MATPANVSASERPVEAPLHSASHVFRNTAMVLSARVVSRLLALVTVIAAGRHLGDAGFGQYQTLVNYVALVSVLVDIGFNTLYMREGARHPSDIQRYLRNVFSVKALLAVVCLVVLAAALTIPGLENLLLPGFVMMVLSSYSNLLRNTFYALQRLAFEAVAIILESAPLLGLGLIGIPARPGGAYF